MSLTQSNDNETPYPVPRALDDPKFRRLFDYWRSRFRGERLPAKCDIDPVEMRDLLGSINIIKVHPAGARTRYQYTLWGTQVTELYGRDFTGRFLDEIVIPTKLSEVEAAFNYTALTKRPHFWQIPVPIENRGFISNRRLLLPLSDDGGTVTHMIAQMIGDPKTAAGHADRVAP